MNAEDIKKLVEQKAALDPRLRSIVRRMESGTATFKETSEYSRIFSEIVGDTLSEHVLSLEDREAVANELLRYGYENINSILAKVQADIDRKNRVNIRPQKASFPQERAEQFSHSLTDPTVTDETIERRANNGTANITMSFHDDYMKENAQFRSNAGLRCYIERQTNGKCCAWCSDIAGRYDYGNEPQDVYRRHDNCDCTVTYENGRQRQDVWSKRSWEVPKSGLKYTKPTVISRSEARRLNEEKRNEIFINNPSIDNSVQDDIIDIGHKLAMEGLGNVNDYLIEEDIESINVFKEFVLEKFGIKYIEGIDKLKNGTCALEIVESVNELISKYGSKYTQIEIYDGGSKREIAESVLSKLRLNAQYLNRPTALHDLLNKWEEDNYIPKGCNSTNYVGKHEYYHFLFNADIDNPKSKINALLNRYSNDGGKYISDNSKDNKHEFVSDLLCYRGKDKKANKLKNTILALKEPKE